jgi:HEAT repeat protein
MTAQDQAKFLAELQNENADVRYAAWIRAGEMAPQVVLPLAKLLVADNPGIRKAADEALKKIVHSVGKEPGGQKRAAVVQGLLDLLGKDQPKWVRTVALRHLSVLAGDEAVPTVAKLLQDPELDEEAAFCLERTPGKAATTALIASLASAKDAFKPRILAALGHRRAEEATEVCTGAMASPNTEIALAGMKALARIGRKPAGLLRPPDYESLSAWQKVEFADSALRYADAQVQRGNTAEALKLYQLALSTPEEHLQCAALIGIAKIGTAEAAAAIFPKLSSGSSTVRITAEKAWNTFTARQKT